MTKNIIIAVLAIVLVLSLVFANSQRIEASQQRELAKTLEKKADAAQIQAVMQMTLAVQAKQIADENAMEAMRQRQVAEEVLKNCNRRK